MTGNPLTDLVALAMIVIFLLAFAILHRHRSWRIKAKLRFGSVKVVMKHPRRPKRRSS